MPALHDHIQAQSTAFLALFAQDSRLSAVFATQQRWLMSHIGLALYFRGLENGTKAGLSLSHFLAAVEAHKVASRNTADAYIKELIRYKYIHLLSDPDDKRLRPMQPDPHAIALFGGWLETHLVTLDRLAGGNRQAAFHANPGLTASAQPLVAEGLLAAQAVRNPEKTFSLFTWLDNGGMVMDWLISNMQKAPLDAERVEVQGFSVSEMAARAGLSRTHLARKLKEAEDLGSIGWQGRRGHSGLWVSRGFREEYTSAQAIKLAIIGNAWQAIAGP
jgi:AraC-like DNA-binding protein